MRSLCSSAKPKYSVSGWLIYVIAERDLSLCSVSPVSRMAYWEIVTPLATVSVSCASTMALGIECISHKRGMKLFFSFVVVINLHKLLILKEQNF